MNINELNEVKNLRKKWGLTQKQLAIAIGVDTKTIQNWEYGQQIPKSKRAILRQIEEKGIAKTFVAPVQPKLYGGDGSDIPMVTLPLIPLDCVAGFPVFDNAGVTLADCEQYAVPEFSARGADYLIRVAGSSMYPRYSNGDILACKRVQSLTFFQWGMIYVIDTQQGILVKRVYENPNDEKSVICRSENEKEFPPFSLPKNEIRSLSIVVGQISVA